MRQAVRVRAVNGEVHGVKILRAVLKSLVQTAFAFVALVTVEATALVPQGWLLIGVVRHILSWFILTPFLFLMFFMLLATNLAERKG